MSRPIGHMLSRPDAVNVAHMVQHCRVLGPGDRFVLWVQGCPLCCEGCHNPQFQPFEDRLWLGVNELAAMILAVKGIEGASFAGGEPFGQVQALARLAGRLPYLPERLGSKGRRTRRRRPEQVPPHIV